MSTGRFTLDERLARDSSYLAKNDLCELRLMHDARWPWLLLIPRVADVREVYELSPGQQHQLWDTAGRVAQTLSALLSADKINVAALGNVVSQLHVHIIARYRSDPAWPAPVWGCAATDDSRYTAAGWHDRVDSLAASGLRDHFHFSPDTPTDLR